MRFSRNEIQGLVKSMLNWIPKKYPIDLLNVINLLWQKVSIYKAEFDDAWISWVCKSISSSEFEIYVNKLQPETRQRFTIAHEIWHITLWHILTGEKKIDHKLRWDKDYSDEEKSEEIEANEFAWAILMPVEAINEITKKKSEINIQEMADKFWVSEDAMRIRLFNLWYNI